MNPIVPNKRIDFIDLAKGICIVLVVVHHANSAFEAIDYPLKDALCIFRMPLYFFLSGLFFKAYEGYRGFLKRKTNKLLIPFLFFHLVSCFVIPFLNKTAFEWHTLWDFLFIQNGSPNGPLWFLICLFWLNQIFYCVYKIAFSTKWPIPVLLILSLLIGVVGYHSGNNIASMNIGTAMTAMPFFCMGYIFRRHTALLLPPPNQFDKYLLPATLCCAVYTILFARQTDYFLNRYEANVWVTYTCGMTGVLAVLFVSKMLTQLPLVSYYGRYSIMILVTHMPYMQRVMPRLFRLDLPYWWVYSLLGSVIVLLSYLLLIPLMKRWLPYVTAQKDILPV